MQYQNVERDQLITSGVTKSQWSKYSRDQHFTVMFLSLCMMLLAFSNTPAEAHDQVEGEVHPRQLLWNLDRNSEINFVSIKKSKIAEVHRFSSLDGSINSSGVATLKVDLASVETQIDVRNQRMREYLFEVARFPSATIMAQIDLAKLNAMEVGQESIERTSWSLDLHGVKREYQSRLRVTRLSSTQVRVASVEPLIINAAVFGLADGVEKLKSLAVLPSIALAIPITFDLLWKLSSVGTDQ